MNKVDVVSWVLAIVYVSPQLFIGVCLLVHVLHCFATNSLIFAFVGVAIMPVGVLYGYIDIYNYFHQ